MSRRSDSDSGGFLFKTGIFAVLAGAAFWIFNQFSGNKNPDPAPDRPVVEQAPTEATTTPEKSVPQIPDELLPALPDGYQLVLHTYFALAYSEPHEQAGWVAYEINRNRLNENWVDRANTFRPDPEVQTESATPRDYMSSGYDKGHLCPAADMAFSELAMDETFLMSNMSPQDRGFNAGIWRELEELSRDWGRKFKKLYVVTGPVLKGTGKGQIGFSKVTVPEQFYKVLLAPDQQRAIAFVLPNARSTKPVMDFACSINDVEALTGMNFFPKLLGGMGEELEGSLDKDAWPINTERYRKRVEEWNDR
ncbi:MAG: DNA/RNA non-specific endonuclease [Saprospiraceae bacterium]|nr:DNA/RNA non-specific endonuclease [Saprospiraceae bacterium]